MENIPKILMLSAFLSLLVDTAVSTPPAYRHSYHIRGENASSSAMVSSTLAQGEFIKNFEFILPEKFKKALEVVKSSGKSKEKYFMEDVIQNLRKKWEKFVLPRRLSAFDDCLVMTVDTIDQIKTSIEILNGVKLSKEDISSLNASQRLQLNILFGAANANVATCLDGFSHSHKAKEIQADIRKADWTLLQHTAGFVYSTVKTLQDKEPDNVNVPPDSEEWPKWLSPKEKALLRNDLDGVVVHATVSLDKPGDYKTVSEAVNYVRAIIHAKAPSLGRRYVIRIKAGKYKENVVIPKDMKNLTFIGDGSDKTFITGDKNVIDGDTTFNSATVGVAGDGFFASGITFENTAGPSKNQAVALRVNADLTAFYLCNIIGHQNTLYVHSFRQFYKHCTIRGTVDFIFGNAAAFFYSCYIEPRILNSDQKYIITAQSRDDERQETGIVIHRSSIKAETDGEGKFTTYLGRPWGKYSRTVVMQNEISDVLDPAGWSEWKGKFALDTLEYVEYMNTGAGAGKQDRVTWVGILKEPIKKKMLEPFTIGNFLGS
ncbi:pectinesterase-like [Salvia hispanica]|uniref:pectinesterase-like n=1 Tax=Salvia hispanica TaxID=49212 RepID=UPI0020090106|nr:pectinesterase-like [Salvia hispanica]